MKKTLPGSSAVRKEATSALRSSAGAGGRTIGAPSSAATMWASEVLPSPGGPGEQDVVERLAATLRRLDEDPELFRHLLLVDELRERRRPQRAVELVLAERRVAGVDRPRARAPRRPRGPARRPGRARCSSPAGRSSRPAASSRIRRFSFGPRPGRLAKGVADELLGRGSSPREVPRRAAARPRRACSRARAGPRELPSARRRRPARRVAALASSSPATFP